jgi:hypothetical protein
MIITIILKQNKPPQTGEAKFEIEHPKFEIKMPFAS